MCFSIQKRILKDEGSQVKKGEVLVKLEAKEYVIAEKKARVEYEKQLSMSK